MKCLCNLFFSLLSCQSLFFLGFTYTIYTPVKIDLMWKSTLTQGFDTFHWKIYTTFTRVYAIVIVFLIIHHTPLHLQHVEPSRLVEVVVVTAGPGVTSGRRKFTAAAAETANAASRWLEVCHCLQITLFRFLYSLLLVNVDKVLLLKKTMLGPPAKGR